MGREMSDGDWTEGEDKTTRGSLAVPFGKAAVRGCVSAALDLEVLEDISQKECVRKNRSDAKERPDKEMAPRVSLTVRSVQSEFCRDVPTHHEARC